MARALSRLRSALGPLLLLAALACLLASPQPGSSAQPALREPRSGVPTWGTLDGPDLVLVSKPPTRARGHDWPSAATPALPRASLSRGAWHDLRLDATRLGSRARQKPVLPRGPPAPHLHHS
jgi:hypothetical protein